MSTAPVRLELVPPDPAPAPAPPQRPAPGAMRSDADRRASAARIRRVLTVLWLCSCGVIPLAFLLVPGTNGGSMAAVLIVGALVMPASAVGLFCVPLVERTRESLLALLVAGLSLTGALLLIAPAEDAALELHVAANQAELDVLAADIRAAAARDAVPG